MRESGILMHITSLPGPHGIGTMGRQAYRFVDFLQAAGQSYWQILPLSPTGYADSPYQSFSAWAGNPYLIDLDQLVEQGLLTAQEVSAPDILPLSPTGYADSPYQSFSAWAGNPYLIDLDQLVEQGLLTAQEVSAPDWRFPPRTGAATPAGWTSAPSTATGGRCLPWPGAGSGLTTTTAVLWRKTAIGWKTTA